MIASCWPRKRSKPKTSRSTPSGARFAASGSRSGEIGNSLCPPAASPAKKNSTSAMHPANCYSRSDSLSLANAIPSNHLEVGQALRNPMPRLLLPPTAAATYRGLYCYTTMLEISPAQRGCVLFSCSVWDHARRLLVGSVIAGGLATLGMVPGGMQALAAEPVSEAAPNSGVSQP